MYDNFGNIISSILTPFQGFHEKNKIISLMSWYSLPTERNLKNIIFAKKFINYLISKNFIITDYTPSKDIEKILKYLNFKTMIFLEKGF